MRRRFATLSVWGLAVVGCSALGLTSDLDRDPGCGDCSELADFDPPPACMSWECSDPESPEMGLCELAPFDGDDDGAPLAECAPLGTTPDCDDTEGANRPGGLEVCDGLDNDCDEIVDEAIVFESTEGPALAVTSLSWTAHQGDLHGAFFLSGGDPGLRLLTGSTVETPTVPETAGARGTAFGLPAAGAAAPLGLLFDGCPSLVVAERTALGDLRFRGRASGAVRTVLACTGPETEVSAAAFAGRGGGSGASVFVHGDGASSTCGEPTGGTAGVSRIQLSPSAGPEGVGSAVELGAHVGTGPPAIADIGDPSGGFGFAAAIVTSAGVEVHRVQLVAGATPSDEPTVSASLAWTLPCDGICGSVAIASTTAEDGTPLVGVAFRDGTCEAGEVRFARARVDGETLRPIEAVPLTAGSGNPSDLVLRGRVEAPSWALVWTDGQRVRARRVASDREMDALVGEQLELYASAGFFTQPLGVRYGSEGLEVRGYDVNRGAFFNVAGGCGAR